MRHDEQSVVPVVTVSRRTGLRRRNPGRSWIPAFRDMNRDAGCQRTSHRRLRPSPRLPLLPVILLPMAWFRPPAPCLSSSSHAAVARRRTSEISCGFRPQRDRCP
ncbi:hypothetical protein GQ55_3G317600 [Panicum hallii var. hallii]|uniref:Uncharacterized protein n=1 Tax=Panicum hallii var. hallii TaxID=1504633 RepID=A0A2T7EFB5_9POAL|nr:hypothetical protein GQ55_3G317600 [Panicum hallii var. hallii]